MNKKERQIILSILQIIRNQIREDYLKDNKQISAIQVLRWLDQLESHIKEKRK